MRHILNEAADRYRFVSPCATLKPLKVRKSDTEPFTLDQVQQILATIRPNYRDYFVVRFFTGMRTGEVHGLKWKYVGRDFPNLTRRDGSAIDRLLASRFASGTAAGVGMSGQVPTSSAAERSGVTHPDPAGTSRSSAANDSNLSAQPPPWFCKAA